MYRSVENSFWTDPDVKALSPETKLLFLYLITNPHGHISGLYHLPLEYAVMDTGLSMEQVRRGIDTLSMGHRAYFDPSTDMVLVARMLKYQGRGGKITSCVQKHVLGLHKSFLVKKLFELYPEVACDVGYPIDTLSMPHRDQEQDQEQDQDQKEQQPQPAKPAARASAKDPTWLSALMARMKDHWKEHGYTGPWNSADGALTTKLARSLEKEHGAAKAEALMWDSWCDYVEDDAPWLNGHYPRLWAPRMASWPRKPQAPLMHRRSAANMQAAQERIRELQR